VRTLLRVLARVLLVALILLLVLAPALWLGRDVLLPRAALWATNRIAGEPILDDLAFKVRSLGQESLTLSDIRVNGPDGLNADRLTVTYDRNRLWDERRIEAIDIDGLDARVRWTEKGGLSVSGLDRVIAWATTGEGSGEPTAPPLDRITVTGVVSVAGDIDGRIGVDGAVVPDPDTPGSYRIEGTVQPEIATADGGLSVAVEGRVGADIGPDRQRLALTLSRGMLDWKNPDGGVPPLSLEGWAAELDLSLAADDPAGTLTRLSLNASAERAQIGGEAFETLKTKLLWDGANISATLEADPARDGGTPLSLAMEVAPDPETAAETAAETGAGTGPAAPRRVVQLQAESSLAWPLRLARPYLEPAVLPPPEDWEGRVTVTTRVSLLDPLVGPAPQDLVADAVGHGAIDVSGRVPADDRFRIASRLAVTLGAGAVSLETVSPSEIRLPASAVPLPALLDTAEMLSLDPDGPVTLRLGDGPAPEGDGTAFAATFKDLGSDVGLELSGPIELRAGEMTARLSGAARLRDPLTDPALRGPLDIRLWLRDAQLPDLDLAAADLTVTGVSGPEGRFSGDYRLDASLASAAVDRFSARLGGKVDLDGGGVALTLGDGGRLSAAQVEMGQDQPPLRDLELTFPPRPEVTAVSLRPDPDGATGWQTMLDLSGRMAAIAIPAGDSVGPVVVAPGPLQLTGDWSAAAGGAIRMRSQGGSLRLEQHGLDASGVAADLRLALGDAGVALQRLDLSAARVVDDAAEITRFVPISLQTTIRPRPTDRTPDRLGFDATLRGGDGALVLDLAGSHDPSAARGRAQVTLHPIRFVPGGLQPADLSPAAAAFMREASGTVSASGRIHWPDPPAETDDPLTLRMQDMTFSGSVGGVLGLDGAIALNRISPPSTLPDQIIGAAALDVGVPIESPQVVFTLTEGGELALDKVSAEFAGGLMSASDLLIPLQGDGEVAIALDVRGVDATRMAELVNLEGLSATGTLSGTVPLLWNPEQGLTVKQARLSADGTGGVIRYDPEGAPTALQDAGEEVSLMLQAIRNLVYRRFSVTADGRPGDPFEVKVNINGSNPDLYDGYPVDLNVTITGRLDELFRDVRRVLGITDIVRQRLETLQPKTEGGTGG